MEFGIPFQIIAGSGFSNNSETGSCYFRIFLAFWEVFSRVESYYVNYRNLEKYRCGD